MNLRPVYIFQWNDGSSRRTDNLENIGDAREAAIEYLAMLGREDDDCTVELDGYESL